MVQMDKYFLRWEKYLQFKSFLNQQLLVYPTVFMTLNNIFNLHFVFNEEKIAINLHLKNLSLPFTQQPSEKMKLASKILRAKGWEIWDLTEKEYDNWHVDEKKNQIKGWLQAAKDK